ncbi:PREDICTED: persephin [Rhinopithecus bieti]|nr:PREDICTED: persephin [Rhinopithecus bieti]
MPGSQGAGDGLVQTWGLLAAGAGSEEVSSQPRQGINSGDSSHPQDLLITMAVGKVLLGSLLLLSLQLGQGWGPDAHGAPVANGEFSSEQVAKAGGTWLGTHRPLARLRRAPSGPCQLWSLTLSVAELGLGYASEEKVIFRYCAGSCPRGAHTQHGLALARLQGQGRAHGGPCCWPTRYTDVAFLDDRHRWQRLPQLSAAACGCGG